jgi:hypothetical protein
MINESDILKRIMIATTVIDVMTKTIISALSPAKRKVSDVGPARALGNVGLRKRGSQEGSP